MKNIFKSRAARRVGVALGAVGLTIALTSCTARLPIGQAAVIYHGGLHSKDFKHCIGAGKNGGVSTNDAEYRYPVNSRDFQFDTVQGAETTPITVIAKDGIAMTVKGAVYFTLNDKCEILQKFHEQVGTTMGAEDGRTDGLGALSDANWNKMLAKYIGVPTENALDRVTLNYNSTELVGDPVKKNAWQESAAKQIVESIKQVTGGEPYFCKPNYQPNKNDDCGSFSIQLNQAQPPDQIVAANADKVAAATRAASQQNQAVAQAQLIKTFGVEGFLELQRQQFWRDALNKGGIQFIPVPAGGSINYTPTQPAK